MSVYSTRKAFSLRKMYKESTLSVKEKNKLLKEAYTRRFPIKIKLLCLSSYLTFGVAGIGYILLRVLNRKRVNPYIVTHMVKSFICGLVIVASIAFMELINLVGVVTVEFYHIYSSLYPVIMSSMPIIIFAFVCLVGIKEIFLREKSFMIAHRLFEKLESAKTSYMQKS